jgi:hypothetical protein
MMRTAHFVRRAPLPGVTPAEPYVANVTESRLAYYESCLSTANDIIKEYNRRVGALLRAKPDGFFADASSDDKSWLNDNKRQWGWQSPWVYRNKGGVRYVWEARVSS